MATTRTDRAAATETVYVTLHPTRGVTAAAVQKATGLPYSTVTGALRKLATAGRAVKANGFWTKVGKAKAAKKATPAAKLKAAPQTAETVDSFLADPAAGKRRQRPRKAAPGPLTPDEDAVRILEEAGDLTEPAQPKRRTRKAAADRPPVAAFARGELRDAVLNYLHGLPEGESVTVGTIAKALNAHAGPVATNLKRMTAAGLVSSYTDAGRHAFTRFRAA